MANTIKEVYDLYYKDEKEGNQKDYSYYNKILKDDVFTPILTEAGLSWDAPVKNARTGEIGRFELGTYNLLSDYIIFRPYDNHGIPKNVYKKVSNGAKNDKILHDITALYKPCDEDFIPNTKMESIIKDITGKEPLYHNFDYTNYDEVGKTFASKKTGCPVFIFKEQFAIHNNLDAVEKLIEARKAYVQEKYSSEVYTTLVNDISLIKDGRIVKKELYYVFNLETVDALRVA